MKVLLTGSKGQLGSDLQIILSSYGHNVIGVDRENLNITNFNDVESYFLSNHFDIIIHCAAYTTVDKAESEIYDCYNVNYKGTYNLVLQAKKYGMKFLYFSTDYIFDGSGQEPWKVNSVPNPINHYGESKLLGEFSVQSLLQEYYIIRISWVFGKHGKNFARTILNLAKTKNSISVVSDQIGSPTYTVDLSNFISSIILTNNYGIYHVTNEGYCSWFEFASEIIRLSNLKCSILPILSSDYKTDAKRPYNSRLDKTKIDNIGLKRLPDWKNATNRFMKELKSDGDF